MIREILLLAFVIEVGNILLRFTTKIDMHDYFEKHLKKHMKVRIHHMYIGFALIVISFFFTGQEPGRYLLIIGAGIALSDILHHFVFLPLLVKKTQFP